LNHEGAKASYDQRDDSVCAAYLTHVSPSLARTTYRQKLPVRFSPRRSLYYSSDSLESDLPLLRRHRFGPKIIFFGSLFPFPHKMNNEMRRNSTETDRDGLNKQNLKSKLAAQTNFAPVTSISP
jgi:hypothetical protein